MSEEEKQAKAEQVKKNLTEMVKNEIFQMTGKTEVMKIIRKQIRKKVNEAVKFYLSQVMPDDVEVSDIVRQTFLAMGKKK